jgi:hypothetical protein
MNVQEMQVLPMTAQIMLDRIQAELPVPESAIRAVQDLISAHVGIENICSHGYMIEVQFTKKEGMHVKGHFYGDATFLSIISYSEYHRYAMTLTDRHTGTVAETVKAIMR